MVAGADEVAYQATMKEFHDTAVTVKKLKEQVQGIALKRNWLEEAIRTVNSDHRFLIKAVAGWMLICVLILGYGIYSMAQYRHMLERIEYMQMYPQSGITLTTSDDEFEKKVQNQINYELNQLNKKTP